MRLAWLFPFIVAVFSLCVFYPQGRTPLVQAQTTPATGGKSGTTTGSTSTPVKADFVMRLLRDAGDGKWSVFSDFEQKYFFNRARCECESKVRLELFFSTAGAAKKNQLTQSTGTLQVLIGDAGCLDANASIRDQADCRPLGSKFTLGNFARRAERLTFDFSAADLFGVKGSKCTMQGTQSIRLLVDDLGDTVPDLAADAAPTLSITYDGEAPAPPDEKSISVTSGNEALSVKWNQTEGIADFRGYTVFCSRGENLAVFVPSPYDSQFHTMKTECPGTTAASQSIRTEAVAAEADVAFAAIGIGGVGGDDGAGGAAGGGGQGGGLAKAAGPFLAPSQFANLDPAFACSKLLRTQRSTRITGLQNDIPYYVGVATIDLHGNASPVTKVFLQKPVATQDFYNGYRQAGGQASGGFCAFAGRPGRGLAPLFGLSCCALLFRSLARKRRRR